MKIPGVTSCHRERSGWVFRPGVSVLNPKLGSEKRKLTVGNRNGGLTSRNGAI
jgi:hypothetical protein